MNPADAAAAHGCLRMALRELIEMAELYEGDLVADAHPETAHPDWPDRIGSQVLDAAQTVERVSAEYRRTLLALRGAS
jgi:hypothetical protein